MPVTVTCKGVCGRCTRKGRVRRATNLCWPCQREYADEIIARIRREVRDELNVPTYTHPHKRRKAG